MQINGRSSGTTTINKIVVAGLQRLPEHDPQQAEQAAAARAQWISSSVSTEKYPAAKVVYADGSILDFKTTDVIITSADSSVTTPEDLACIVASLALSPGGLPCLDVEASSKAKAAVFVPGFPTVKTNAGKFPHSLMVNAPHLGVACYIADWVKASWSKTKLAAITAKGGERLSSEEVEAAYNSPDMDLARSLEFIAVSRAGKMEVTCSFRHAEIVAHLKEIPGIELMHPDNGVLRLVYPKTELKRNLLKLGLNCS
ncbi:hypothetical protein COO60DRAFT_1599943, partial [Scenedesmus sp. NREL 46B-D3]